MNLIVGTVKKVMIKAIMTNAIFVYICYYLSRLCEPLVERLGRMDNRVGEFFGRLENGTDIGEKVAEQLTESLFKGLGYDD